MRRHVLTALLCAACPTRPVGVYEPNTNGETYTEIDVANRNLDILFVIDNSGSMGDEQAALVAAFPDFIDVLRDIPGGLPNLHIGVVTSDVGTGMYVDSRCTETGDDGVLRNGDGNCQVAGRFITDVANDDGARTTNYSGSLENVFSCIADVGVTGCGFEQHLEAMRLALDPTSPAAAANGGFLRDDAYLGVIIISDEDDCSAVDDMIFSTNSDDAPLLGPLNDMRCVEFGVRCAEGTVRNDVDAAYTDCTPLDDSPYLETPAAYADFLRELRPVPHTVMVGGMTGNPTPYQVGPDPGQLVGDPPPDPETVDKTLLASCTRPEPTVPSGVSTAEPGVRLRAFLDAFPAEDSTSASICDDPFREVLLEIAAKFGDRFRNCLLGHVDVADVNGALPGLQLDCHISDVDGAGGEVTIPRCAMTDATTPVLTSLPCWWAEVDTVACASTESGAVLHVERDGTPPIGTRVVARCVAE